MLHSHTSNSAKNLIISAAASFAGMLVALPVAFLIVSMAQPASALQSQQPKQPTTDASYKQYLEGYTQGYLASVKQDNSSNVNVSNCADTNTAASSAPSVTTASASYKPMAPAVWSKTVTNSYNTYKSSTNTTNNITTTINKKHVTNINSNNTVDSNNTAVSSVTVKDSTGTVVASGTSANGNVVNGATSVNNNSNNTTTNSNNTSVFVKDSFNTDSHDKTTTNTTIIDDSFNKVDTTVNTHVDLTDGKKHEHDYHHNA